MIHSTILARYGKSLLGKNIRPPTSAEDIKLVGGDRDKGLVGFESIPSISRWIVEPFGLIK
jgi:hypothetical protein